MEDRKGKGNKKGIDINMSWGPVHAHQPTGRLYPALN